MQQTRNYYFVSQKITSDYLERFQREVCCSSVFWGKCKSNVLSIIYNALVLLYKKTKIIMFLLPYLTVRIVFWGSYIVSFFLQICPRTKQDSWDDERETIDEHSHTSTSEESSFLESKNDVLPNGILFSCQQILQKLLHYFQTNGFTLRRCSFWGRLTFWPCSVYLKMMVLIVLMGIMKFIEDLSVSQFATVLWKTFEHDS